jgi:hypothetical protein
LVIYDGEIHTIAEWANLAGVKQSTLRERLRRGWSMAQAMNAPRYQRQGGLP